MLDDATLDRVERVWGDTEADHWLFVEQVARWKRLPLTPAQREAIERLEGQVTAPRGAAQHHPRPGQGAPSGDNRSGHGEERHRARLGVLPAGWRRGGLELTDRRLIRSGTSRVVEPLIVVVVVTLASATTAWWLVGDLTETTSGSITYAIQPPNISAGWVRAIGIGSAVIGGIAVAGSLYGSATGRWDPGWRWVVAMVAGAGVIVGYGWRVLTAGVAGANQGAGLVVLLGAPIVLGLLGTAGVRSYRLLTSRT